jgi:hypothetical protein
MYALLDRHKHGQPANEHATIQVPRCESWLKKACVETHDPINCKAAHEFCSSQFMGPYMNAFWNPYDVSKVLLRG